MALNSNIHTENLSGIDLNLLTALECLLADANVGRAAERMRLSQPAMSHALKRLRLTFRDPLLVRVGARMQLTSRAESLRAPVEQALARIRDLLASDRFDPATSARTFRLSISDNATSVLVPPLFRYLEQEAPGISIRLQPTSALSVDTAELAQQVDLVVACEPARFKGFFQQRLFADRDACALRARHRLARRMRLDAFLRVGHVAVVSREFAEDPVDTWLREEGHVRRVVLTVPTYLQALHVVAQSDLVAVVPERLVRAHAAQLEVVTTATPLDAGTFQEFLLHPARTHADAGCVWLRQVINEIAGSLDPTPRTRRR